jgi:hypothetical protein
MPTLSSWNTVPLHFSGRGLSVSLLWRSAPAAVHIPADIRHQDQCTTRQRRQPHVPAGPVLRPGVRWVAAPDAYLDLSALRRVTLEPNEGEVARVRMRDKQTVTGEASATAGAARHQDRTRRPNETDRRGRTALKIQPRSTADTAYSGDSAANSVSSRGRTARSAASDSGLMRTFSRM